MDENTLKILQDIETSILIDFNEYCKNHNIKYSLSGGTLLGAVRHKGPIPWDDDIDVFMSRNQYDRFVECFNKEPMKDYYLEDLDLAEKRHINHAKIRKNNTILANQKDLNYGGHNGIWLDIFPYEKVKNTFISKKIMKFFAICRIVYTRNYPYDKGNIFLKLLSKVMIALPKSVKLRILKFSNKYILKYKNLSSNYIYMCMASPQHITLEFNSKFFDSYTFLDYNNQKLMVISEYKEMLIKKYGNYMEIPPINERICVHNIKDFRY